VPIPSEEELLEDERVSCDHDGPLSCRKGVLANVAPPPRLLMDEGFFVHRATSYTHACHGPGNPARAREKMSMTIIERSDLERYARQIVFPGMGEAGQRALLDASVTLIGCGALGSALANLIVRAGVGRLVVADRDFVELNNLQRQSLYDETHVARNLPKAIAAAERLRAINSQVEIVPHVMDVNPYNV